MTKISIVTCSALPTNLPERKKAYFAKTKWTLAGYFGELVRLNNF